jgi:hypothetical protein
MNFDLIYLPKLFHIFNYFISQDMKQISLAGSNTSASKKKKISWLWKMFSKTLLALGNVIKNLLALGNLLKNFVGFGEYF